jgi:hydrogenase maturation protease
LRILVAGIGNVLLGDDGFGVEVVRALARRPQRAGVRVVDYGIRGLDLAYALLDHDAIVLVDVARRGGTAGTLYVIEPQVGTGGSPGPDTHGMHPARAMQLAEAMGGPVGALRLVACEPARIDEDELAMGLSEPVAAAVDPAVALVDSIVTEWLDGAAGPRDLGDQHA